MRGQIDRQESLFVVVSLEQRVPQNHPLRPIKRRTDELLAQMNRQLNRAYSSLGRPSIPPEQLLKALLLQALYSIRSEIALMEPVEFNQLYRWFVDLPLEQRAWTPEVFSMNRERFAAHGLVQAFFDALVRQAILEGYVSDEHFTVDGTLLRSWASLKSVQPKDTAAPSGGRRRHWCNEPNAASDGIRERWAWMAVTRTASFWRAWSASGSNHTRADSPWTHRGAGCGGAGPPTGAAADAYGALSDQPAPPQTGRRNLRLVQDGGTAGPNPLRGSVEDCSRGTGDVQRVQLGAVGAIGSPFMNHLCPANWPSQPRQSHGTAR
jgi:transposase